jgi:phenylacetate-coenzyme A ligase PaaK-like adenylate-forming protein
LPNLDRFFTIPPYSLGKEDKQKLFAQFLMELTQLHYSGCANYRKIIDALQFDINSFHVTEEIPFLPVRLFKDYKLLSIPHSQVFKTITSSGTSGQQVSKIFLDKETAGNQTKVLAKIAADFLGKKRIPMLIIDTKAVLKNRNLFSARGAGILGFSMLGTDVTYCLTENMDLDLDVTQAFLKRHSGEPILLFGFTFMIWEYFYKALVKANIRLPLENSTLLHGGGWKKLADQAVDNQEFKSRLNQIGGITRVYNYYGMVEQTGSIFMECEQGRLHSSIFSDIMIRDHTDFSICEPHRAGLVQLVSLLPASYPGHSLLTEDMGEIIGEDDCPCGRLGKTFKIYGRVQSAEVRGCSDTYEKQ